MVLLKNEKQLLPLSKEIKKLAVIGPNANDVEVLLANYNGFPSNPVTPLAGIKAKLPNAEVLYAQGSPLAENLPILEPIPSSVLYTAADMKVHGMNGEYFDSLNLKGTARFKQVDSAINFNWWDKAPAEGMNDDRWAARWTGVLVPKVTGKYALGAEGKFGFRVYMNDSLIFQFRSEHAPEKQYDFYNLVAGKAYNLKVEFYDSQGDASMKLLWQQPGRDLKKKHLTLPGNLMQLLCLWVFLQG